MLGEQLGHRRDVGATGQQGAQRLRHACRVGIAQIHDEHVAAGTLRRVQLFDHRLDTRRAARIVRAQQHAVRPRIGHDHHPLLRIGRQTALRRGFCADQTVQQRNQVDGRRVLERHDDRFAAWRLVERRDDLVDAPQVVGVIGDDQRIRSCVGGDAVVRGYQRTQHVDQLQRRFVAQRNDLCHEAVPAAADRTARHLRSLNLGVGFHDELGHAVALDRRDALQAQRRQERRINEFPRHGPRRDDVDRALDLRVEDEVAAGDLRGRLDHGVDIGVDEVQRDGVVGRGRSQGDGEQEPGGISAGVAQKAAREIESDIGGRTGEKGSHRGAAKE